MQKESASEQTFQQRHERRKQVGRLHKKSTKVVQIVDATADLGIPFKPKMPTSQRSVPWNRMNASSGIESLWKFDRLLEIDGTLGNKLSRRGMCRKPPGLER